MGANDGKVGLNAVQQMTKGLIFQNESSSFTGHNSTKFSLGLCLSLLA
jgi:hypothetical protein